MSCVTAAHSPWVISANPPGSRKGASTHVRFSRNATEGVPYSLASMLPQESLAQSDINGKRAIRFL